MEIGSQTEAAETRTVAQPALGGGVSPGILWRNNAMAMGFVRWISGRQPLIAQRRQALLGADPQSR